MSRFKQYLSTVAAIVILGGLEMTAGAAEQARSFRFNIDNQSLAQALRSFGHVAGQEVLFTNDLVRDVKAVSLQGEFTAEAALSRLLSGTGLAAKRLKSGVVTIVRASAEDAWTSAADQMRMAAVTDEAGRKSAAAGDVKEDGQQVIVEGQRDKPMPFKGANMDLPRTVDDVQAYYIFDAKTLEQSGATNIENFLKQRLTMNTTAQSYSQQGGLNINGNISSIDLRGLGADKTLILVNGRRMANVDVGYFSYQPDLNGIPISAVERIEVLPTSASGIYGGSAIGGVINVILKKDYSGGELRASYDNAWKADAPSRTLSLNLGRGLEGGKTNVTLSASWSDSRPMLLEDRREIYESNLQLILTRHRSRVYSNSSAPLGLLPNIMPASFGAPSLILDDGTSLGSRATHIPAGTSATTSQSALRSALLANAGVWDFGLPPTIQGPTGLFRQLGVAAGNRSVLAGIRRQMTQRLELFADLSYTQNRSSSVYNPGSNSFYVPVGAPSNPFDQNVYVALPMPGALPMTTQSSTRSATIGASLELPGRWTAELDFTQSRNVHEYRYRAADGDALGADLLSGALNPFVDTLAHPLDLTKYLADNSTSYSGSSRLRDISLRGAGPLAVLPWGTMTLAAGLEHRQGYVPMRSADTVYANNSINNFVETQFARRNTTGSGYVEVLAPLIKQAWLPGIYSAELQFAGRSERYKVDTGTATVRMWPNFIPPLIRYSGPTLNGEPYFSDTTYSSHNYTVGIKYQPLSQLTVRASRSTAFLPPGPSDLIRNPVADLFSSFVNDPVTDEDGVEVTTYSGGNPGLKPQNSRSLNAGIVWQPQWQRLRNLRLNLEYYKIEQFDAIGSLDAQQILNQEDAFPGRVVRDSSGRVTEVDMSSVNLYHRETEGMDIGVDYTLASDIGRFTLHAAQTQILHLKNQYAQNQPEYEAAGYSPTEGGAPRHKSSGSLAWEFRGLAAAWTASYIGSYQQYGAAGGPDSTRFGGEPLDDYLAAQGGTYSIPSQIYHDLLLSYTTAAGGSSGRMAALLSGVTMQLGMRNVFNDAPPFDAAYGQNYYLSPYGDMRLRTYWFNIKKAL